jgi:hypothetical protein
MKILSWHPGQNEEVKKKLAIKIHAKVMHKA